MTVSRLRSALVVVALLLAAAPAWAAPAKAKGERAARARVTGSRGGRAGARSTRRARRTTTKRNQLARGKALRRGRAADPVRAPGAEDVYRPERTLTVGMIGLGRMGNALSRRLIRGGHTVVGFDRAEEARTALSEAGGTAAGSVDDLIARLPRSGKRVVWVMLPAGEVTEKVVHELGEKLRPGDILIDGGNSQYQDSQRRAAELARKGIEFVDVGTSGGVRGAELGFSLMVGGKDSAVEHLKPVFQTLAPDPEIGWGHMGPSGAGHRIKMIHNGVEYGIMKALAEGYDLAQAGDLGVAPEKVSRVWRKGSIVSSFLNDLADEALNRNPELDGFSERVSDTGEGRGTLHDAIDLGVSTPVISAALMHRFQTQREGESIQNRFLQALRFQFGGHDAPGGARQATDEKKPASARRARRSRSHDRAGSARRARK